VNTLVMDAHTMFDVALLPAGGEAVWFTPILDK
jgi:hypothetical protein